MRSLQVACVQLCSTDDAAENVADASGLIREAAAAGARFIATPEMTTLMDQRPGALAAKTAPEQEDKGLAAFRRLAADLGVTLLIGSMPIKIGPARYANRSFLLDPQGAIAARYDKIHMFDVEIGDGQTYKESADYEPGRAGVLTQVGDAQVGLSICYDLRFAALYRALAVAGAEILCVPAAFTRLTGQAHWHVLLRARAIENLAFVVAPGQGGRHRDGRETYGHSLIVAPWGEILAEGGEAPGFVSATLDLDQVAAARARIPCLSNARDFSAPASPSTKRADQIPQASKATP